MAFDSDFMAKYPMHEIFKRGVAPSETAQFSILPRDLSVEHLFRYLNSTW